MDLRTIHDVARVVPAETQMPAPRPPASRPEAPVSAAAARRGAAPRMPLADALHVHEDLPPHDEPEHALLGGLKQWVQPPTVRWTPHAPEVPPALASELAESAGMDRPLRRDEPEDADEDPHVHVKSTIRALQRLLAEALARGAPPSFQKLARDQQLLWVLFEAQAEDRSHGFAFILKAQEHVLDLERRRWFRARGDANDDRRDRPCDRSAACR